MIYILENSTIKITISNLGGELQSITGKKECDEYLWNGRPYGWNLSAPTLFPIIGKVKNGEYRVSGKSYKMNQHGFASREEHKMISNTKERIVFELKYDNNTLDKYPYKFALRTIYSLQEDEIKVEFQVENLDDKEIVFSLGSHPSFLCPFKREEELEDYYLEFDKEETASIMSINKEDFLIGEKRVYLEGNNRINLTKDTFKGGTLIFNNLKSKKLTLKSTKHNKSVSLDFEEFPFLSLWATEKTRPFVCIEPWFGHADYEDFKGDFKEKAGVIVLGTDEEFKCSYKINIG